MMIFLGRRRDAAEFLIESLDLTEKLVRDGDTPPDTQALLVHDADLERHTDHSHLRQAGQLLRWLAQRAAVPCDSIQVDPRDPDAVNVARQCWIAFGIATGAMDRPLLQVAPEVVSAR